MLFAEERKLGYEFVITQNRIGVNVKIRLPLAVRHRLWLFSKLGGMPPDKNCRFRFCHPDLADHRRFRPVVCPRDYYCGGVEYVPS